MVLVGLVFAAALQAAPPAPSPLAPPAAPAAPVIDPFTNRVNFSQQLIAAGRFAEARQVLLELEKLKPADSEVQFLLALLDRQDQDYESAIKRFHRILVNEPNAVRVRLELGRTYFEAGDYANSERQFRFARAGKIPPEVIKNIDTYLYAIRGRKTFTYGFSLAIAPDSNLNSGPATDTITLYGLPFQLSQNAVANSGVGLAIDGNAEWAPAISKTMKFRIGAQGRRVQYSDSQFNDMTLNLYAGPRLNLQRWQFNLLGTGGQRWYGDKPYLTTTGASADATYYVTSRMGVGAGLVSSHLDYKLNADQSGNNNSIVLNYFYTPTPSSLVRAGAQLGVMDAKLPVYSSHMQQFNVGYTRELKGGLTVGVTPSYSRISYDAPLVAFGQTRVDNQYTAQLTLINRRIDFHGVTPQLIYTYTRNKSTIPLYSFSRSRFEIGITSAF